jgi:hypothetical protein
VVSEHPRRWIRNGPLSGHDQSPAGSIQTVGPALRCDRRPATIVIGLVHFGTRLGQQPDSPPYEVPMRTRKPGSGDLSLELAPGSPTVDEPLEPSSKADRQEFFLPVNGFVWFFPEEVEIINHPAFQRLARINQLGQAYYVFRGATHKRIEHVLGVVGVVQQMISAVRVNSDKARRKGGVGLSAPLSESEERFVPPRCLAWAVTIAPACQPMFFGSVERRFSVPA